MRKRLLHITLLLISALLIISCQGENIAEIVDPNRYMQFSTRSGDNNESDKPCFIFWKQSDFRGVGFHTTPTTPYVYRHPEGMIDDYNVTKYNTIYAYPPLSEWVHAVGVSPGNLVSATNTDWAEFKIPTTSAGLIDVQCAPVILGSQQTPFNDPLMFKHQLTRLEIHGYCGESMMEDADTYIDVKDISVSISSGTDSQWQWFPEKLEWNGSGDNGQYEVKAYTSTPSPEIVAETSADDIILYGKTDHDENSSKIVGSFYLIPGFNSIKIKVKTTYIDTTNDGKQEIPREWDVEIGSLTTIAGRSYPVKLKFDRSQITLGVTLEPWGEEKHNI